MTNILKTWYDANSPSVSRWQNNEIQNQASTTQRLLHLRFNDHRFACALVKGSLMNLQDASYQEYYRAMMDIKNASVCPKTCLTWR